MQQTSKYIAIIVAVVAVLWVGSGFFTSGDNEETGVISAAEQNKKSEDAIIEVRVRDFTAQEYRDDVVVTGRSQASRKVDLRAETEGQIEEIVVEEGDTVVAGQILAKVEVRDRLAKVQEATQRVSQRQIEYNAAKQLENKGFNSKTRLAEALANLEDARAILKQMEVDISKIEIKAPFDGIISEQDIEMGDYLSVGDKVFTIVDLDPIEFVGFVSERRIQDIEVGSEARANLLDGQNIVGKVSFIAPAADPGTRTFRVIVQSENVDLQIKEGLTAQLHVPAQKKTAHKISPSILSLNDAGEMGVKFVNDKNIVEFMPVKILTDKPDGMYISGPPNKARLITVGQDFVKEGQVVKPIVSKGGGLL